MDAGANGPLAPCFRDIVSVMSLERAGLLKKKCSWRRFSLSSMGSMKMGSGASDLPYNADLHSYLA